MCLKIDLKAVSRTGGEGAVRALDVHLGLVLVQGLLAGHRHPAERAHLEYEYHHKENVTKGNEKL